MPKKLGAEKNLSAKKNVGSEKMWVPKKMWVLKKIMVPKKMCVPQKYGSQNKFKSPQKNLGGRVGGWIRLKIMPFWPNPQVFPTGPSVAIIFKATTSQNQTITSTSVKLQLLL